MGVTIFLLLTIVLIFTKIGKNVSKNGSDESSFDESLFQELSYEDESEFADISRNESANQTIMNDDAEVPKEQESNTINNSKKSENGFSLREAVIYSSILERPYK